MSLKILTQYKAQLNYTTLSKRYAAKRTENQSLLFSYKTTTYCPHAARTSRQSPKTSDC